MKALLRDTLMQSHHRILVHGLQLLLLSQLGTQLSLAQTDSTSGQNPESRNELKTLQGHQRPSQRLNSVVGHESIQAHPPNHEW